MGSEQIYLLNIKVIVHDNCTHWIHNVFFKGYQKYLYGVNPFSYVQKALLTGYVVEQENAICPPEVGFCNAFEPVEKEHH